MEQFGALAAATASANALIASADEDLSRLAGESDEDDVEIAVAALATATQVASGEAEPLWPSMSEEAKQKWANGEMPNELRREFASPLHAMLNVPRSAHMGRRNKEILQEEMD